MASGLVTVQQISDGDLDVGTGIALVEQFLGRRVDVVVQVVALDPLRTFAAEIAAGPFRLEGTWHYERRADATQIHGIIDGETAGFFKLAEALVARAGKRQIDADCATLKDVLEAWRGAPA